jgi:hypothetical protein
LNFLFLKNREKAQNVIKMVAEMKRSHAAEMEDLKAQVVDFSFFFFCFFFLKKKNYKLDEALDKIDELSVQLSILNTAGLILKKKKNCFLWRRKSPLLFEMFFRSICFVFAKSKKRSVLMWLSRKKAKFPSRFLRENLSFADLRHQRLENKHSNN